MKSLLFPEFKMEPFLRKSIEWSCIEWTKKKKKKKIINRKNDLIVYEIIYNVYYDGLFDD